MPAVSLAIAPSASPLPAASGADMVAAVWAELRADAAIAAEGEPALAPMFREFVLDQPSFGDAIASRLGTKLAYHTERGGHLHEVFREAFASESAILTQIAADLQAVVARDPACDSVLVPFLWFKGFQATTCYRVAHWLWGRGRRHFAQHIQSLVSEVFAVDIHPAARIGCGILLDHATGFVVGETAVIEDDVSLLHAVTLGGTGKERGDRHPKVRRGVLIGAGAKILGNIEIGEGAKIGAGSVVLDSVLAHTTVVGVPAEPVEDADSCELPAFNMDHHFRKLSRTWAPEI